MSSFKPGDWVIASKVCKKPKKFTIIAKLKKIKSVSTYAYPYILEDGNYCETVKLWQPKVGEWCWFWDENYTTSILAKFENISNGLFVENHGNIFEYCEPFIGQLPTHLKDQS